MQTQINAFAKIVQIAQNAQQDAAAAATRCEDAQADVCNDNYTRVVAILRLLQNSNYDLQSALQDATDEDYDVDV